MRFNTKFDKGEHAWYMKDNKPTEVIISAIEIFYVGTNQDTIKYNGRNVKHSTSWLDHTNLHEGSLFRTKGELLESLFGSDRICRGENCGAINGVSHSEDCLQEHERQCAGEAEEMPEFKGTREALQDLG